MEWNGTRVRTSLKPLCVSDYRGVGATAIPLSLHGRDQWISPEYRSRFCHLLDDKPLHPEMVVSVCGALSGIQYLHCREQYTNSGSRSEDHVDDVVTLRLLSLPRKAGRIY